MPGEDKISSFSDLSALKSEKDEVMSLLKEVDDQIKNMSKFRITYRGGTIGTFRKDTEQMQKDIDKLVLMQEKLATATIKRIAAAEKAAGDQLLAEQKLQQAVIRTEELETRKAKTAERSASQIEAQKKREQKMNDEIINDYKQLSLAYNEAALKAKNYALQLGAAHPVTEQATKDANAMGDQLKKLDAMVGDHRRNVGNYASGWTSFNNVIRETPNFAISATTGIQALSNNIPMFADEIKKARTEGKSWMGILKELGANLFSFGGIATIATIALTALPKILSAMETSSERASKHYKSFAEVQQEATKNTVKERVELQALLVVARDENKTKAERSAAVRKINDMMPSYIGDIKLEEINTEATNKKLTTYLGLLEKKALAQAYLSKIQELYTKRIELEGTSIRDNISWYEDLWVAMKSGLSPMRHMDAMVKTANKNKTDGLKATQDEIDALELKFDADLKNGKAMLDLDKMVKEEQTKNAKDYTNETIKNEQDRLKALAEIDKIALESKAKLLKEIAGDEKNSFQLRSAAYQSYADVQKALAAKNQAEELDSINVKLKKIDEIEGKSVKKRTDAEKSLLMEKDTLLAQKKLAEAKHAQDVIDINRDMFNSLEDLSQAQGEKAMKSLMNGMESNIGKVAAENMLKDVQELEDFNKLKFKNYEDYEKALTALVYEQEQRRRQIKLDSLIEQKTVLEFTGKDTAKIEQEIADLKLSITQAAIKKEGEILKDGANRKKHSAEEIKKDTEKAIKDAIGAYTDLGASLLAGSHTAEANRLQEQIDKNNELKATEIERINQQVLSEEEKAARIHNINVRTAAQNEQLEKKQRDEKLKAAKFERDAQALKIFGEALYAHFKLIAELGPAGIPIAIAQDAIAVAQIGALYAKPLPKFEKGTNASPEGFAITDEKGPELYIEPGGKTYMGSSDGPTLRYLKRDTKIISHAELMKNLMPFTFPNYSFNAPIQEKAAIGPDDLALHGRMIVKAIKDNRPVINNQLKIDMKYEAWKHNINS